MLRDIVTILIRFLVRQPRQPYRGTTKVPDKLEHIHLDTYIPLPNKKCLSRTAAESGKLERRLPEGLEVALRVDGRSGDCQLSIIWEVRDPLSYPSRGVGNGCPVITK